MPQNTCALGNFYFGVRHVNVWLFIASVSISSGPSIFLYFFLVDMIVSIGSLIIPIVNSVYNISLLFKRSLWVIYDLLVLIIKIWRNIGISLFTET